MMKRIYICLLMLMVLSTATFAQKKGSPEYNAQLRATIIAMDSVLKYSKTPSDILMRFADDLCEKFKNDPVVMDSIASSFFTFYSDIYGERRFFDLKKRYPTFVDAYYTQGLLYHTLGWIENPKFDPSLLKRAKEQIDSAKLLVPNSPDPYLKWIRWQGKYDPEGITGEIDTLKLRVPGFPAYLEVARDFERYSNTDRSFLPSAKSIYGKAERDFMTAQDYSNYSLVCFRVGDIQKKKEDFEEGVAVAEEGIKKFPHYPYMYRMKLWNQGGMTTAQGLTPEEKNEMYKNLYQTSLVFKEIPDTFARLSNDYRWMALGNMETKHYSEAVKFLKKQLELGVSDDRQHAIALRNLVDCYTKLELYHNAFSSFNEFENYLRSKSMNISISDYQRLFEVYGKQGADTLNITNDRLLFLAKADSVLNIMGQVSPEDIGYVNYNRLQVALTIAGVDGLQYSSPGILVASNRLVKSMLSIQEKERKPNDWYYLMRGMRYALEHYIYTDKNGEAWVVADEMLKLPKQIAGMSQKRSEEYNQHIKRALQLMDSKAYSIPGKKLIRSWKPFE